MEKHMPEQVTRIRRNLAWHKANSIVNGKPLEPQFGLFWNCCVNVPSPEAGVERVATPPHGDTRNVAVSYCALLAYWADGEQ